jgi:hypothetical protein
VAVADGLVVGHVVVVVVVLGAEVVGRGQRRLAAGAAVRRGLVRALLLKKRYSCSAICQHEKWYFLIGHMTNRHIAKICAIISSVDSAWIDGSFTSAHLWPADLFKACLHGQWICVVRHRTTLHDAVKVCLNDALFTCRSTPSDTNRIDPIFVGRCRTTQKSLVV